jgi:hypothetical protein
MTKDAKILEIKEKVEALVNEAIELLEANYDMDNAKFNNPAYMTMMDLNGALMELDCLDDEDLKIED